MTDQPETDEAPRGDAPDQQGAGPPADGGDAAQSLPRWAADIVDYPEGDPGDDPRWALWLFWIWVSFATASIAFMTILLVLGWWLD